MNGKVIDKKDKIILSAKKEDVLIHFDESPSDFLAEFTIIPDKNAEFTFRFRANEDNKDSGYFFRLNTPKQQIRIGNQYHHSDTNKGYADRDISFEAGKPLHVRLFMHDEVITCFVEDVCTLTMNAHDIDSGDIFLELNNGKVEISELEIKTPDK
jgi:hypothetical protein